MDRSLHPARPQNQTLVLSNHLVITTVEFLNKPADEDDGEEVCYLDTESEAGYTFKCGPATPPSYPDWWYKYDWPEGSSQAAFLKSQ